MKQIPHSCHGNFGVRSVDYSFDRPTQSGDDCGNNPFMVIGRGEEDLNTGQSERYCVSASAAVGFLKCALPHAEGTKHLVRWVGLVENVMVGCRRQLLTGPWVSPDWSRTMHVSSAICFPLPNLPCHRARYAHTRASYVATLSVARLFREGGVSLAQ